MKSSPALRAHHVDQFRLVIQELLRNAHFFGAVQGSLLAYVNDMDQGALASNKATVLSWPSVAAAINALRLRTF